MSDYVYHLRATHWVELNNLATVLGEKLATAENERDRYRQTLLDIVQETSNNPQRFIDAAREALSSEAGKR